MADLPSERLDAGTSFINTGVDFAGPIVTKPNCKNYIAIFVRFATKAVHIELVTDLSKDSCILALKRFISRRGLPEKLFSNNGSKFIGARNDLMKVRAILCKDSGGNSVTDFLMRKGIQWVTIPPRAPLFGGLWEAAVKSKKRHLRRSVGTQILLSFELNTYLIQIEAILNSRPITSVSNDPNDLRSLTPAHFLLGKSMNDIPQSNHSVDDDNLH